MASIKVKNKDGQWETVGVATVNGIEDIDQYDKGFDDGAEQTNNIRNQQDEQYLENINTKVRSYGVSKAEALSDVPQAIDGVYAKGGQAGYESGRSDGYLQGHAAGITEGAQAEYDRFWDGFQNRGNTQRYQYAFAYDRFAGIYNPKYPINCDNTYAGGSYIFYGSTSITDTLVDISIPNSALGMFYNCNSLVRIPKLIVTKNTTFSDTFKLCSALEDITIEGEINNDINFADSTKLLKKSIANIIGCLLGSSSGKTLTLSKTAVNKAFETSDGENDGIHSDEWTELVATKSNWTISLV